MERNESTERIDLRRLFRLSLVYGWVVVLFVVVGAGSAYLFDHAKTKIYSSSAVVRVFDPNDAGATTAAADARVDPVRQVQIEVLYANSTAVSDAARKQLGAGARLVNSSAVTGAIDSDSIKFVVQSASKNVARDGAQAWAQAFVDQRRSAIAQRYTAQADIVRRTMTNVDAQVHMLDTEIAASQPPSQYLVVGVATVPVVESELLRNLDVQRGALLTQANGLSGQISDLTLASVNRQGDLEVVEPAVLPGSPIIPLPHRDEAVAGALGLLIGLGVVGLRIRLHDNVKTSADLAQVMRTVPFVAAIPPRWSSVIANRLRAGPHFDVVDGRPALREAYRAMCANLRYGDAEPLHGALLLTGATAGTGTTIIAANLAVGLARGGARVVVVDCDLRHPALGRQFGLGADTNTGLASVLAGTVSLDSAIRSVEAGGTTVDVLVAGPKVAEPADLLGRSEIREIVEALKAKYDHVVLAGPPVLPAAEALALARMVDGVVIVVQSGTTSASVLGEVEASLRRVAAPVVGAALVGVRADRLPAPGVPARPAGRGRSNGSNGDGDLPGGAGPAKAGHVLVL